MTFTNFMVIMLLDIAIIAVAVKTKSYAEFILTYKKYKSLVTMICILFVPLFLFIILVNICNSFFIKSFENTAFQVIDKRNILMDLQELGINCILYSPTFFLVMCFIIQYLFFVFNENEEIEEQNIEKIQTALLRVKISIITNNITILLGIGIIFLEFHFNLGFHKIDFVHYIRNYSFFCFYSEDAIRFVIIILLGICYYIGIFLLSNYFINTIFYSENKNQKLRKYKTLAFCFLVNICVIPLLYREVKKTTM